MKQLTAVTVFMLMTATVAFAREQSILARVTVYWANGGAGSDKMTRQHKCATGARLSVGHCAVDPRRIPYGSRVVFPDGCRCLAADTGTAVKNRKAARLSGRNAHERSAIVIDRFFETKRQALAWAKTNPQFMMVRVVAPGQSPSRERAASNKYPRATLVAKK